MYRDAPPPAEIDAAIERDLAYEPRAPDDGSMPGLFPMFVGGGGIIAAAFVAMTSPNAAAVMMVASVGAGIVVWRLSRRGTGIVLSVVRGDLVVRQHAFVRSRIALHLLEDVIVDGDDHHACITLVPEEPHRRIELTKKNIASSDCVEWAAKIRVFLRAHGWKSLDERPPVSSG